MVKIRMEMVVFDTLGWIWGVRAYIEQMERTLPEAEERERDELRDLAQTYESYSEGKSEVESKWDYWIPRVLSYSLIILVHSIVETQLVALCERLRAKHGKSLKVSELSGSPIERAKIFLSKVVELNVGEDPDWETLRDLAKIRNAIVHHGGALGTDQQKEAIEILVAKYSPELLIHIGDVRPSLALCKRFLDTVEVFFRRLFHAAGLPEKAVFDE